MMSNRVFMYMQQEQWTLYQYLFVNNCIVNNE